MFSSSWECSNGLWTYNIFILYCLNGKVKHGFCSSEAYSSHKRRHFSIIITSYCPVVVRASNSCLALIVTVCFNVQYKSMFQHCLTMKISPFLWYSPVFLNLSLSLNILLIIIIPSLFPPLCSSYWVSYLHLILVITSFLFSLTPVATIVYPYLFCPSQAPF